MSRIHEVIRRYDAARAVAESGVSVFSIGDSAGAQLNAAIRRALFSLGDERSGVWAGILQAANALRWRRMTQPQPNTFQPIQLQIVEDIHRQVRRLRQLVADESLLDQLAAAASAVGETDSPTGAVLLESVLEVGVGDCVVVASKASARVGIQEWLDASIEGARANVLVPSDLSELSRRFDQSYIVAPPAFVTSALVTAPATPEVTFLVPAWFRNTAVPISGLGSHAEGRSAVKSTLYRIGDTDEARDDLPDESEIEDPYVPQPIWGSRSSGDRQPSTHEVEAWKVLLGGGLALWLDDGDRIRSLNPRLPEGDRVDYESVANVVSGTYLVLREGETERGAMYEEALRGLGTRAAAIIATQERWKRTLQQQLLETGARRAAAELSERGVRSAGQVHAWAEPRLICPQRDADFSALLEWLGEPLHPTYDNAITLRRAVYKASSELRKELELAVGQADLRALEHDGILHLDMPREGFRGMIVARVLARSPFTEIVHRTQVRVPFKDGNTQWLE